MLAATLAALAATALAALVGVVNVVATERVAVLTVLAHRGGVVVAAVLAGYSVAAVATSQGHFIIFMP